MGEEPKAAPAPKKSSGGMKQIVVILFLVIASALGGMALYKFVLAPRLEPKKEAVHEEENSDNIPADAIAFDFEEAQTAVVNNDPKAPNSILIYTTSMICENEETKALVEKNKQWFMAMLSDLHRNRTKEELADPAVEKSILEEAQEQANSLLRRLQAEPKPEIKVIKVLHLKFTVFTL